MSTTTTTNASSALPTNTSTPSVGLTSAELWTQLLLFYVAISGGLIFVQCIIAIGIIRTKELRNRFFVILCAVLFARVLLSAQNFSIGVYRSFRTLGLAPMNMVRFWCHCMHINLYYAAFLEMLYLVILVVDRFIAITASSYYRRLTVRQAIITCIIAFFASIFIKLVPTYLGVDLGEVIACMNINSPIHRLVGSYGQNMDVVPAVLILVVYIAMMLYIQCYMLPKLKKASEDSASQAAMISVKRQMKLLPLLRRLVLTHCGLTLLAKIVLGAAPLAGPAYELRLTAYGGMLIMTDLLVNAVVLLATNKEVRWAAFAVCGIRFGETTVSIISQNTKR